MKHKAKSQKDIEETEDIEHLLRNYCEGDSESMRLQYNKDKLHKTFLSSNLPNRT